jgi:Dyp-type peroxidase family
MSAEAGTILEVNDVQSGALRARPSPYAGSYILLRIDDRRAGREMLRRVIPAIASAAHPTSPAGEAWISAALTFQGLKALGVPQASLDSFPAEFQQGMAARAAELGDVGENAPEHWELPLGSPDVHVGLVALAPDAARLEAVLERARQAYQEMSGVKVIWRQDCYALPTDREPFGFKDGISHPAVEGSGIPGSNPKERPLMAGEFVLGYKDEMGELSPIPQPDVLGKNGTYIVFRKLHQRVAAFRQYLRANSAKPEGEELLAAKIVGRWRSGAPLVLAADRDDPELGADPTRNNNFLYHADDDVKGLKCPVGSHIRRMNPRDGLDFGNVNIRRMIRRGTAYGPPLAEGIMDDDGADRGLCFVFVGAHLKRQFEFVQTTWVNDGIFIGASTEKDPLCGSNDGTGVFTIPQLPIRRRLQGLPQFVVTRGGEYFFMPGLRALQWLADQNT